MRPLFGTKLKKLLMISTYRAVSRAKTMSTPGK